MLLKTQEKFVFNPGKQTKPRNPNRKNGEKGTFRAPNPKQPTKITKEINFINGFKPIATN